MELKVYQEKFEEKSKTVFLWLENEYFKIRTGRVSGNALDEIKVDSYGTLVPINNVANISVPEPRVLIIKPYDMSTIKDIATAINNANLGVNPQVDADKIRIAFPALTEDARKELIKKAKIIAEDAKIKIRKIRQEIQDTFKKDDDLTDDDKKSFNIHIDEYTKKANSQIEVILEQKSKDILVI